jgi:hypothetical protein
MAAPNLATPSSITGKVAVYSCTSTLAAALSNAAASGKVFKVNTIRATNIDASTAFSVDVTVFRSSSHTYLANSISIPVNSTLLLSTREEYIYLEEGDAIYAKGNIAGKIDLIISYEEIF